MSPSQGRCGSWPHSVLSLEHQPSHGEGLRRDSQLGGSPGRPAMSCCCPGTTAGSVPQLWPPYLMEPLSSSICSRRCCASSCRAARSCCSLQMYSAVFCRMVALLTWGAVG